MGNIGTSLTKTTQFLGTMKNSATQSANMMKEKTTQSVCTMKNRATTSANMMKEKTTQSLCTMKNSATQSANTMKEKTTQYLCTMKNRASTSANTMKEKTSQSVGTITETLEQKIHNTKRTMVILVAVQIICSCYKAYREIVKGDERIFLMGKENESKKKVLEYLEPLETPYSFTALEDQCDVVKCKGITNGNIGDPFTAKNTSSDIIWKRNNICYHLFSNFLHRYKLENYLNALKDEKKKTTLLICIPYNAIASNTEAQWIQDNKTVINRFDRRHLVITDYDSNCKSFSSQDIHKTIRGSVEKNPIVYGNDESWIGAKLFLLKYTGNMKYEDLAIDIIIICLSLFYGLNHVDVIKIIGKNIFRKFFKRM